MDKDAVGQAYFKRRKPIHATCMDDGKGGCERDQEQQSNKVLVQS